MTTHWMAAGMRLRAVFTGVLMVAAFLAAPHVWAQSLEPSSLELLQEPGSIDPGFFRLRGAGTNGEAIGSFTTSGEFSPSRLVAIGRDDARQIVANGEELVDAAGVALGAVTRILDVQMLSDGSAVVNADVGGNRVMLRFVGDEVAQLPTRCCHQTTGQSVGSSLRFTNTEHAT